MKREDFSYTCNAEGYMLKYKEQNIGGAGIIGKYKGKGRARQIQINDYREMAEREVQQILNGTGQKRFYEIIDKIESTK